jgi:hypothetical protein
LLDRVLVVAAGGAVQDAVAGIEHLVGDKPVHGLEPWRERLVDPMQELLDAIRVAAVLPHT